MAYEDFVLNDDPELLKQQMLARQAALQPRWVPHDGSPIAALIVTVAERVADTRSLVPPALAEAFRAFGRSVHGLQQIDAVPASTTSTWVLADTAGHTIPSGTPLAWRPVGADPVGLRTAGDIVVPAGQSTATGVTLTVDADGTAGNGVPAGPLELLDALAFVSSVTSTAATSGGVDAETAESYVGRLADLLTVPSRTPVRPEHFALMARDVPGVFRCRAIANYDADTDTDGVAACVSLYAVDQAGVAVDSTVAAAEIAYFQALREVGFLVRTGTPTYTAVALTYAAVPEVGASSVAVKAALDLRASQLLDPARFAGGDETPPVWRSTNVLPLGYVQQQLGSVPGVAYIDSITLNGAAADLTLPGKVGLPKAPGAGGSTVTGTVSSP